MSGVQEAVRAAQFVVEVLHLGHRRHVGRQDARRRPGRPPPGPPPPRAPAGRAPDGPGPPPRPPPPPCRPAGPGWRGSPRRSGPMAARAPAAWSGRSSTLTTRPPGPTARTRAIVSAPEPVPASSTRHPGPDVPPVQDGADVLGVHHLGPPVHPQDVVGQAGAQRDQAPLARGAQHGPLRRPDDLAVGQDAHVVVERAGRVEIHQVVPAPPVDQQADLAGAEDRRSPAGEEQGEGEGQEQHHRQDHPHDLDHALAMAEHEATLGATGGILPGPGGASRVAVAARSRGEPRRAP